VSGKGLVAAGDLQARQSQLAARPAGHDHDEAGNGRHHGQHGHH
jgi:hypothetical protein